MTDTAKKRKLCDESTHEIKQEVIELCEYVDTNNENVAIENTPSNADYNHADKRIKTTEGDVKRHEVPKVLTCTIDINGRQCKFIANKASSMSLHQIVHNNTPPYHCTVCKYQSAHSSHFNRHILSHNNEKLHKCPYCKMAFTYPGIVEKHIGSLHPNKLIKCEKCGFATYLGSLLDKHVQRQHSQILSCQECAFIATMSGSMQLHRTVHQDNAPWQCTLCEFQTPLATTFNFHILTHNNENHSSNINKLLSALNNPGRVILQCEKCEYCTPTQSLLNQHHEQQHLSPHTDSNLLNCTHCKFVATEQGSLDLHQVVHQGAGKPYACTQCEHVTQHKDHFNRHALSHYNDRPYSCPHCDRAFTQSGNVERHILSLHPNAIMKCSECDFSSLLPSVIHKHRQNFH